jgi:hypothetical protein
MLTKEVVTVLRIITPCGLTSRLTKRCWWRTSKYSPCWLLLQSLQLHSSAVLRTQLRCTLPSLLLSGDIVQCKYTRTPHDEIRNSWSKEIHKRFGETYCLHLQVRGSMFLRNVDIYLRVHMASQLGEPTPTKVKSLHVPSRRMEKWHYSSAYL